MRDAVPDTSDWAVASAPKVTLISEPMLIALLLPQPSALLMDVIAAVWSSSCRWYVARDPSIAWPMPPSAWLSDRASVSQRTISWANCAAARPTHAPASGSSLLAQSGELALHGLVDPGHVLRRPRHLLGGGAETVDCHDGLPPLPRASRQIRGVG